MLDVERTTDRLTTMLTGSHSKTRTIIGHRSEGCIFCVYAINRGLQRRNPEKESNIRNDLNLYVVLSHVLMFKKCSHSTHLQMRSQHCTDTQTEFIVEELRS